MTNHPLDDENVKLFLDGDGIERCVDSLMKHRKNEITCMNIISILYFLSHSQDIAMIIFKKQELRHFLDTLDSCSTCSSQLIKHHFQLSHYTRLLQSKFRNMEL